MTISLNVSGRIDPLTIELLQAVDATAARLGVPYCIVGAFARDVVLGLCYGMDTGRATRDIDFVIMVQDWNQFDKFRQSLLVTGNFNSSGVQHRLTFKNLLQLDIVPFGAIENPPGEICWPPDFDTVMSTIGLREAASHAIAIRVATDLEVPFVSPAALALLKLIAWSQRGGATRGKDSMDFSLVINNYLRAGNSNRLYDEFAMLLDDPDFDMNAAGAFILGRDVRSLAGSELSNRLGNLIASGIDESRGAKLLRAMSFSADYSRFLLRFFSRGLLGDDNGS